MTYDEIIAYLNTNFESQEHYSSWLSFLKTNKINPSFSCIHIYGRNNKENISHYLNEIYTNEGYSIGYFTHEKEKDFLRNIQVNNECISEEDFIRIFNFYENEILTAKLSSFGILTLISFVFFKERNVQMVINETFENGLNFYDLPTIDNRCFVFSDFSNYEIKNVGKNSRFISNSLEKKEMKLLGKYSLKKQTQLIISESPISETYISPYLYFDYSPYKKLNILSPSRELLDAAILSIETIKANRLDLPVSEVSLRKSLSSLPLPCRLEKIQNVIVDGSSSEEQLPFLLEGIERIKNNKDVYILFASEKKNGISKMISSLKKMAKEIVLTTLEDKSFRKEEDYSIYLDEIIYQEDWKIALHYLLKNNKNALILTTGSKKFAYLVKEYLETL